MASFLKRTANVSVCPGQRLLRSSRLQLRCCRRITRNTKRVFAAPLCVWPPYE